MSGGTRTFLRRVLLPCLALLLLPPQYASSSRSSDEIEGVTYKNYVVDEVPWSIHVIQIERGRPEFEIISTLGGGTKIGLSTLTRQLRTIPRDFGTPIAAI